MMATSDVATLLARLDAVEARLQKLAAAGTPTGLTTPDAPTGERWEAGQAWAHIGEFVPYWHHQTEIVLAAPMDEPARFGRIKTDEGRLAGIERGRHATPQALIASVTDGLAGLRAFAGGLAPSAWDRTGIHPIFGELPVRTILQRFEVDHLEEHADQLEALAGTEGGSPD